MSKFGDLKKRKQTTSVDDFIDGADQYQNAASIAAKMEKKEPEERLNAEIPKSLHKLLKIRAAEEGAKMKEVVIKALCEYLEK